MISAVAVLCTILGVWTFCNARKERRKKEAENHAAFMKYCADGAEIKAHQGGKKTVVSFGTRAAHISNSSCQISHNQLMHEQEHCHIVD